MIISLPVTILIYQIVAALGVLGLTALIVHNAGIDFQLMFLQTPIDKMRNWKRFKHKTSSKLLVVFFTAISIVILFIPTLFTLATELMGVKKYYYTNIKANGQEVFANEALDNAADSSGAVLPVQVQDYPPFDDFRTLSWQEFMTSPDYEFHPWITTESIVQNYLYTHFGLPFSINKDGVWYGTLRNLTNFNGLLEDSDHVYNEYSNYQRQYEAPTLQTLDATTGTYRTDGGTPTYTFGLTGQQADSFSLHACNGQLTSNLPAFENHQLLAVSNATAGVYCYPQFDASLPITVQVGSTVKRSVLDDNDRVFRTARSNRVGESSSAISVSAMSLNDTFVTMAIKKTAHITYHNDIFDWENDELLNCSSANLDDIYRYDLDEEYNQINHTKIMCHLKSLSQQNPGFNMLQAASRFLSANFSVNSVYTYSAPTKDSPFGGMAVDLTWFTSYTLESPIFNFPKNQEFLIAHVLIETTDVFSVNNRRSPVLPNLVKMQAALKAGNTHYISKFTASVHVAYDIAGGTAWIFMVAIPGCVFFLWACLASRQRGLTLRARISACSTVDQFDDRDTLVAGRNNTPKPPLSRPTQLSFCPESATTQASIPLLMVDGKSILLQQ
ncbi:hypothetical protein MBANPS3_009423 [Mucor bainieri]